MSEALARTQALESTADRAPQPRCAPALLVWHGRCRDPSMPGIADQRRGYPGFGGGDASRGLWQTKAGGLRAVQDGDHHGQGFGDEIHHRVDVDRQLFADLIIGQVIESVEGEYQPGERRQRVEGGAICLNAAHGAAPVPCRATSLSRPP
jgi:hypothetical protein